MYLVKDFESFFKAIRRKYKQMKKENGTTVYTFGILLADASRVRVEHELSLSLTKIHRLSKERFHFFAPGYTKSKSSISVSFDNEQVFFDKNAYDGFIESFRYMMGERYNFHNGPVLILLEMDGRDLEHAEYHIIPLDRKGHNIFEICEQIICYSKITNSIEDFISHYREEKIVSNILRLPDIISFFSQFIPK